MKHCVKCKTEKPFNEFHKDNLRPDGLFPYCKQCRRGTPKPKSKRPIAQVLDSYFISDTGCWEWTGTKMQNEDYGIACFKGKRYRAHRLSYLYHIGQIPEVFIICHKCDNPSCINPDHLYAGTHQDNTNDMMNRNRCNPVYGVDSHNAVLDNEKARKIFMDNRPHKYIANDYGVAASTVSAIKTKRIWKHATKKCEYEKEHGYE